MKRWLTVLITAAITLLGFSSTALCWGLLINYKSEPAYYLVTPLLQTNNINYCIAITDPRFDPKSIDIEIRQVFKLWLRFRPRELVKNYTLTAIPCETKALNLKVTIGPVKEPSDTDSEMFFSNEPNRTYLIVTINTSYVKKVDWFRSYRESDFAWFVQTSGFNLQEYLDDVSIKRPRSPLSKSLRNELNEDYQSLFNSTYPTLIHEFGHAFGLCDTYKAGMGDCDPKTLTPIQPASVMRDAVYFYITEDDAAGFRALFAEYPKK